MARAQAHAFSLQAKLPVEVHCCRTRCGSESHAAGCVRARALDGRTALRCVSAHGMHTACTRHAHGTHTACNTRRTQHTACTLHAHHCMCTTCSARPPARAHPVLRNDAAALRHLGVRPRTLLHRERAQGGGAHVRPDDGTHAQPCAYPMQHMAMTMQAHRCIVWAHRTCASHRTRAGALFRLQHAARLQPDHRQPHPRRDRHASQGRGRTAHPSGRRHHHRSDAARRAQGLHACGRSTAFHRAAAVRLVRAPAIRRVRAGVCGGHPAARATLPAWCRGGARA